MTEAPLLWGAALACALGGAVAGTALGSTPMTDRSALESYYQTHRTAADDQLENRALPDRYPLVTGSGVVPVEQLSDRGLFSQARYRPVIALAAHDVPYDDDPGPGFEENRDAGSPPPSVHAAVEADTSVDQAGSGQGKIIDVQDALALS
jgi:hypothetical protein